MSKTSRDDNAQSETSNFVLGDFTKNGFKSLTSATRHSNALPADNDYNFYKLNASYCNVMNIEGDRLLRMMNSLLRRYDIDENINTRQTIEDKIELIVEANDAILEKVGDNMDELNGIKKKDTAPPVELQTVTAQLPTISGSWNRIDRAVFSVNSPTTSSAKGKSTVHLLTGKNIIRPQTFFKDKIENSNNYPWQPRITEKPNSIRPLALILEETEFGDEFCHPYQTELDQFEPTSEQLKPTTVTKPLSLESTLLRKIETPEQLNDLLEELREYDVIAVDLEHHSYRTFMGITCLMQISTVDADYIIDTLSLRDKLHVLNEIFTRPSVVKVFHGADSDILWLQRDLSIYVVNLFDTHQAAKQLGYSGLSLSYLLQRFCGLVPNKHFQLADWRIRPLPDELIQYAREDTHYLIYIYCMLKNELLKKANGKDNILRLVVQNSTEICKKRYFKPKLTDDSHMDFYRKCKRLFDNRQMFALKELYQWRDKIARQEDESTGYVLPNHMLLQIAELLPREMQGILACCNPVPPLVRSNLLELHHIILKAREQSAEKPIMKEDNRSLGSTQQFSKINIDSTLHCPHDLTKQMEFRDDLPILSRSMTIDEWEREVTYKFNDEWERRQSIYSIFNKIDNLDKHNRNDPIKTGKLKFLGPYERYKLVKPFIQAQEQKEAEAAHNAGKTDEDKSTDDRIASLHQHFLKLTKECPPKQPAQQKSDPIPNETPAPSLLDTAMSFKRKLEDYENLSQMEGSAKKRRVVTEATIDDCFFLPDDPLHTPVPNVGDVHRQSRGKKLTRKQKRDLGGFNNNQRNPQEFNRGQGKNKKKKNRGRNRKPAATGEASNDNTEYQPYDYSSVDYRQYQGGAGSSRGNKQKGYDSKFRGKSKRSRGRGSNKFSTFKRDKQIKI